MGKDYYSILGLKKDASEDEIRKAYRKMALKWHPDRQANSGSGNTPEGAKKKFQEIGEAFEVLSDKNKRAVYDQYGEDGLKGGPPPDAGGAGGFSGFPGAGGAGGFPAGAFGGGGGAPGGATFSFGGPGGFSPSDPNDIFSSIFGAMGGMGGGMPGGAGKRAAGGMGGFPGMGGMPGGMGGFDFGGAQAQQQGMPRGAEAEPEGPKEVEKRLPCTLEELYSGAQRRLKVARTKDGQKEEKVLSVDVAKGWRAGTKVRFAGAGNERGAGTGVYQDMVFVIEEKPHARFRRTGDDLHITQPLSIADALDPPAQGTSAAQRAITHLDGRKVTVNIPRPPAGSTSIQAGRTTRVANEGMPISKTKGTTKGDLIVEWNLVLPDRLDEAKRKQLRQLLTS